MPLTTADEVVIRVEMLSYEGKISCAKRENRKQRNAGKMVTEDILVLKEGGKNVVDMAMEGQKSKEGQVTHEEHQPSWTTVPSHQQDTPHPNSIPRCSYREGSLGLMDS
jgi:hypothetical protein